ncbi:hypothetical protein FJR38_13215 [Anabaena sp. UHCC 0253]|uniref:hypothetical protein n=1 Tax=Anabaena sp. UHCC 0253 TaxID=2590019 RepID=UPI001446C4BA|nr:hypothetical protein [Anabaena sp. UHCC 0253]MTJ53533.1 hypothetical protein [Anabaena sp. UHCC 0253]
MKMRRLALVAGVATLSAVAFSPKAQALDENVDFSGNIPTICNFNSTQNGLLEPDGNSERMEGSNGSVPGFNIGIAGETSLNCNGAALVSVSTPARLSAPAGFNDPNRQALLYDTGTSSVVTSASVGTDLWTSNPTSPFSIAANTNYTFRIPMNAGNAGSSGNVVPGIYQYRVTVTAAPN